MSSTPRGATIKTRGSSKSESEEVYQEAALNLRYEGITAITAIKLERAMALLQLGAHHLVERGLSPGNFLGHSLDCSGEERGHQSLSMAANSGKSGRVIKGSDFGPSLLQVMTDS